MGIDELANKFGIQIGLLLYFIWQNASINKEYNNYVKDIAQKAVDGINKSTEVDTKMLEIANRLEKRLDDVGGRSN